MKTGRIFVAEDAVVQRLRRRHLSSIMGRGQRDSNGGDKLLLDNERSIQAVIDSLPRKLVPGYCENSLAPMETCSPGTTAIFHNGFRGIQSLVRGTGLSE